MKKNKAPRSVTILILTAITIVFWAIYATYQAVRKIPDLKVDQQLISPLNPDLDVETLDKLKGRNYFEDYQIPDNFIIEELSEEPIVEIPVEEETVESSTQSSDI